MLTKGEFLDRLRENPLPEDVISQNSSLICGLFYFMGFIAGRMRRRQNVSGGEKSRSRVRRRNRAPVDRLRQVRKRLCGLPCATVPRGRIPGGKRRNIF